jgi:hypothetical protein
VTHHVWFRGALEFPTSEDATSAFRAIRDGRSGDAIVAEGITLSGSSIEVSFKNFVALGATDPDMVQMLLVEAARHAVSGRVPVDQEGGQKTEIRAQRPVGRAPRRREVVE